MPNNDIQDLYEDMYSDRLEQFGDVPFHMSVDLDSTLADTRHRVGIIEKYTSQGLPIDWAEYAKACSKDAPTALVYVLQQIQYAIPWHVVSGRSGEALDPTLGWLKKNRLYPLSVNLENDPTQHAEMGHVAWKVHRVLWLAKQYPIRVHIDDWSEVSWRLEEESGGKIRGLSVTPPGMVPAHPTQDEDPEALGKAQRLAAQLGRGAQDNPR